MKRGDFIWIIIISAITASLLIPASHKVIMDATNLHPYVMGFIKFAILSTMGELLAIRIGEGRWKRTAGMAYKTVVWGIVGVLIVLMFSIFSNGVAGAAKANLLFAGSGTLKTFLIAFYTSTILNLTFGPAFMAAHSISDAYIDMKAEGGNKSLQKVISKIDWCSFIKFVVGKTIPFFWIPVHTITFMLPGEYRIIAAAYLSVALGIILGFAKRMKTDVVSGINIKPVEKYKGD